MERIEYYEKLNDLLSKFENGKERYMESPVFNQVIQMLIRDCDHIKIIDQLIRISEDSQNALKSHLEKGYFLNNH